MIITHLQRAVNGPRPGTIAAVLRSGGMTRRPPDEPGLPLAFHPLSNGEYAPLPRSDVVAEAIRRTLAVADTNARRLGMSRRAFLRSSCGMAATLTALAACSSEEAASTTSRAATADRSRDHRRTRHRADRTRSSDTVPGTGGTFSLPPESTIEEAAATTVLAGSELVVDVQTHLLEYESGTGDGWGLGFPQASCGDDPALCMGIDAWLDLVLGGSDTAVAVLSAIPVVADPDPLSTEVMERARRQVEQLGCVGHVLIQGHATPTTGELPAALDAMAATAAEYEIAAWKAYTHEGPSWRLDDDIGNAFCDQVRALGQRIICVHKGLGPAAASPVDVGPAAANHPDLTFCIYHSGLRGRGHRGRVPRRRGGSRRRRRRPADRLGARRRDRRRAATSTPSSARRGGT